MVSERMGSKDFFIAVRLNKTGRRNFHARPEWGIKKFVFIPFMTNFSPAMTKIMKHTKQIKKQFPRREEV